METLTQCSKEYGRYTMLNEKEKDLLMTTVLNGLRAEGHENPLQALNRMVDEYWGRKPDTNYGNWKKLID